MRKGDVMLPRLIQSLETNAREIDQTFASSGARLGEGLALFESLKERLSVLSGELAGPEIVAAGLTLQGLAGQLRAIGDGLSGETRALKELSGHSNQAAQALDRLLDHMRLITILARSARIEAVSVQAGNRDVGDFTCEIVALTSQGQRTVQTCAREHDHLGKLLGCALAAQEDFERRYGAGLLALAGSLEHTLAEVTTRQSRGAALTSEAAAHSGRIAAAAGGAIVALQSGDSIRQRLEHAIAALHLLSEAEAGAGEAAGLGPDSRRAVTDVLRRLEAAQLEASAAALAEDAGAIQSALALLTGDTADLLDLVRSLYSGGGGASFLAALEADLAQASDLLDKCDRARADVDRVTRTLTGVLETCQETVTALAGTVSSIMLIGMNAGLRAARVGTGGRSLVVIAQELKLAADHVAADAARLTPTFADMQRSAAELTREERMDAAHFAALDQSMRAGLAAMRRTGDRLGDALGQLTRVGGGFHDVLGQVRLSFSDADAMSDAIAAAAAELSPSRSRSTRVSPECASQVSEFIQQRVWSRYTMAAERNIHGAVLEQQLPAVAPSVVALAPNDDLLECILF